LERKKNRDQQSHSAIKDSKEDTVDGQEEEYESGDDEITEEALKDDNNWETLEGSGDHM
jgi:hypothetical protein